MFCFEKIRLEEVKCSTVSQTLRPLVDYCRDPKINDCYLAEVLSGAGTGGDKATEYPEKEGLFLMKVASQVRSAILGAPQLERLPEDKMKVH